MAQKFRGGDLGGGIRAHLIAGGSTPPTRSMTEEV
jgi:hypothetical protein